MRYYKSLVLAAAVFAVIFSSNSASALTDDRLPGSTLALAPAGRTITVEGRREAPRRGEVEVHGTVRRAGRDLRISTGRSTVRLVASARVPVYYAGRVYRPANLEVGDRVLVIGKLERNGLHARTIQVVNSVSARAPRQGAVSGLITSVNQRRQTFRMRSQTGRTIVIDAARADSRGRSDVRFRQLRAGDRVTVIGQFRSQDVFVAEAIQIPRTHRGRDDRENWRQGRRD